jgi:hypothetical protein
MILEKVSSSSAYDLHPHIYYGGVQIGTITFPKEKAYEANQVTAV